MAVTRTLTEMIQEVRDLADVPGTNFITDAMVTRWLNLGLKKVYEMAYAADPDAYDMKKDTSITTVAGTDNYTLPADFWKQKGISLTQGDFTGKLERMDFGGKRDWYNNEQGVPRFWHFYTRSKILLFPTPDGAYPLTIWYVPVYTQLATGSDTFDGIHGFEEYGIYEAAIKCRIKSEGEINELLAMKSVVENEISDMAAERDIGGYSGIEEAVGDTELHNISSNDLYG